MKKLRRSTTNKTVAGVIGGFAEYFKVDAILLRVLFVFFLLATGLFPGVIAYIVAIFLIPLDTDPVIHTAHSKEGSYKKHGHTS